MQRHQLISVAGLAIALFIGALHTADGWEAGREAQDQRMKREAVDSIRQRLVYIEATTIGIDEPCNKEVFERPDVVIEKGTGLLLRKDIVLTVLHVVSNDFGRDYKLRCFAVYRATDRLLRIARPGLGKDERPDFWRGRDLAILSFPDPIADASLEICPDISGDGLKQGATVFVAGYDGDANDASRGYRIGDPGVYSPHLKADCSATGLCRLGQELPGGFSGSPVIDQRHRLVGVFKGGSNADSIFEPLAGTRKFIIDQFCSPGSAVDRQKQCSKVRAEREQRKSFTTEAKRIQCDAIAQQENGSVDYPGEPGYRISGFVIHEDSTDEGANGWVGHAEYILADNGAGVIGAKVQLGCSDRGRPGWAQTRISGTIRRILSVDEENEIKQACRPVSSE